MKRKRGLELYAVTVIILVLGLAGQASAQWRGQNQGTPRDGACFYLDGGYSNRSFCLDAGQSMNRLPSGFNDQITSIRVFGRATVTVYDDADFRGTSETFDRSQNELREVRKRDDRSRVWSDRISSVRVNFSQGDDRANRGDWGQNKDRDSDRADQRDWGWNRENDRDRDGDRDRDDNRGYGIGPAWGRGPQPRQGACFFRDTNFGGDYFCMARGESIRALPSGFNDRISSVRLFGGTRVSVFPENDFRGPGARFNRDAADLRDTQVRDSDRSWNDRISSIQVE